MSVIWFFLSCFIIGIGKAARDTVAHHFEESIFNVKNEWLNKWLRSDWRDWPLHFGIIRFDGWHVFDMIHYAGMAALVSGVIYFQDMDWVAGPAALAVIGFVFTVFYKIVFIRKG